jgi:hypothetical protein
MFDVNCNAKMFIVLCEVLVGNCRGTMSAEMYWFVVA